MERREKILASLMAGGWLCLLSSIWSAQLQSRIANESRASDAFVGRGPHLPEDLAIEASLASIEGEKSRAYVDLGNHFSPHQPSQPFGEGTVFLERGEGGGT